MTISIAGKSVALGAIVAAVGGLVGIIATFLVWAQLTVGAGMVSVFGNPDNGPIAYQLAQAIEGMAEACEAFGSPVISGNVSLYNESFEQPIYPTPVVGMLGLGTFTPRKFAESDIDLIEAVSNQIGNAMVPLSTAFVSVPLDQLPIVTEGWS